MISQKNNHSSFFTGSWEYNLVILLPIIGAIATVLTPYFSGSLSPGVMRTILLGAFSVYFFAKRFVWTNTAVKGMVLMMIYLLICSFFSSNYSITFNVYFKFYISSFLFLVGYYYSHISGTFFRWNVVILFSLIVYLLDFVLSNYLGFGETGYRGEEDSVHFGGGGVNLAKNISIILLMGPLIFNEIRKSNLSGNSLRILFIVLMIFSSLFVSLAFKRGAILGFGLGLITFLLLTPNKNRYIRSGLLLLIVLMLSSPLYFSRIEEIYYIREDAIHLESEENLEKQGRYLEYKFVIDFWENAGSFNQIFGQQLFNERNHFGIDRMFHTDYMSLLSGAGLLGLFFYFVTSLLIFRELYISWRNNPMEDNRRYFAMGSGLIVALMIFGLSGTIMSIEPRGLILLYLGGLLGNAKHQ